LKDFAPLRPGCSLILGLIEMADDAFRSAQGKPSSGTRATPFCARTGKNLYDRPDSSGLIPPAGEAS
jgi:hypothetical protein